ncbi:hypothetical protein QUA78_18740 [Microcoleus sp. K4-B3]
MAQLTYSPSSEIDLALSYVRSYSRKNDVDLSLGTGSNNPNQPFNQSATRGNHFVAFKQAGAPRLDLHFQGGIRRCSAVVRGRCKSGNLERWSDFCFSRFVLRRQCRRPDYWRPGKGDSQGY